MRRRQLGIVLTPYLVVIAVLLLALAAWQIRHLQGELDEANRQIGGLATSRDQHKAAAVECSDRTKALEAAATARERAYKAQAARNAENRATMQLELQRLLADRQRPGEDACQHAERVLNNEIRRRHPGANP